MATVDDFLLSQKDILGPGLPEEGWDRARLRHHLAHHGLIPWQLGSVPNRLSTSRPFEAYNWCPGSRHFLSESSAAYKALL
jgi:hypothetical protein